MKKARYFRKYLAQISEVLVFLFVLAVLAFSFYKILTITNIINPLAYGVSCDVCDCDLCGPCDGCDGDCDGCWPCPPCPEPTPPCEPTPPEPTPTPTSPPGVPPPSGGDGGGPPGAPVCGAPTPNAPTLLSVSKSGSCADLSWTAVDSATHYLISYGESSGNYVYGVDNTGKTTSFSVCGLDPAKDYCFAVRAVNDCAPSELSNEICGTRGQVLGVTTLADTGSLTNELIKILCIIGTVCLSSGLGILLFSKKAVLS